MTFRLAPSPFALRRKALGGVFTKARGEPCGPGETAKQTGCTPASGGSGGGPPSAKKPAKPAGKPRVALSDKSRAKVAAAALAGFPLHLVAGLEVKDDSTGLAKDRGGAFSDKTGGVRVDPEAFSGGTAFMTGDMNGRRVAAEWYRDQYPHADLYVPDVGAHELRQVVAHEAGHFVQDRLSPEVMERARRVFSKERVPTPSVLRYESYFGERRQQYEDQGLQTGLLDRRLLSERIAEAIRLKVQEPELYRKLVGRAGRAFLDALFEGEPPRKSLPPSPFAARRKALGGVFQKAAKESYFETCPRDRQGHCKPSGQGDDQKPAEAKQPSAKPAEKKPGKLAAKRGRLVPARRVGKGKAAKIVLAGGKAAPAHIKPSMVPPDWTDVRVSADPDSDVLVTARDAKGRLKTVYSDSYTMRTAALKFARIRELMKKEKAVYAENQRNRKREETREEADCLWLIQEQATRPGSDKDTGAKVKAYGATTLRAEHVKVQGKQVVLDFIGKEGIRNHYPVKNPDLAKMLLERKKTAKSRGGRLFDTDAEHLRSYASGLDGGGFLVKDFRTARGTAVAVAEIKRRPPPKDEKEFKARVKEVATAVSQVLNNTPVMALQAYIDPSVWAVWRAALPAGEG